MHGEHDDPTLSASADRPWRRAPYGMGQPPSPYTGPSNEESHDDAGRPVDDSGPAAPMYPRRYSTPTPPDNDEEVGTAWYGPDTSRIDWRAVAPAAGILATAVGLAVWAAWPDGPTEAKARPTPAPVATLRYVETRETTPTPLDSPTSYFATPTPTTTKLLHKTPSASPPTAPPLMRDSTREPRERAGEGDGRKGDRRMSVEPDRPAAEQQQEKPRPKRTTKPRSGGDADRPGGSTSTGGSSSGGTLIDRKCDQLFPPNKPEFAIRNAACHQMYGSG